VRDPDGHALEFVEYTATGRGRPAAGRARSARSASPRASSMSASPCATPPPPIASTRTCSASPEIWRGGRDDTRTDWINMKVPDGTE